MSTYPLAGQGRLSARRLGTANPRPNEKNCRNACTSTSCASKLKPFSRKATVRSGKQTRAFVVVSSVAGLLHLKQQSSALKGDVRCALTINITRQIHTGKRGETGCSPFCWE